MNALDTTIPALEPGLFNPTRRRQLGAVFRLELARTFLGRRAWLLYVAALLPVGLMLLYAFVLSRLRDNSESVAATVQMYAHVYQILLLRMVVFFGCLWAFLNLFRGEVLDRSLHFYFLTPVRREILVVGKFLAGWVGTSLLFGLSTLVSCLLLYVPFGAASFSDHLLGGPGLGQLLTYLGITSLACLGYGAVALLLGLFFTNPILPAVLLFGWELINFLLPPMLKRLSVIHYLKSLAPVPVSEGLLAVVGEPSPGWLSVLGLAILATALVALSCWWVRSMEIRYGDD
jgi:ABC-type transport system involved in multi-copper enzyme maturation permease subunit